MSYLIGLYVYYHGNNLHRFGFVKGEIPDEEHRNQGLTYEETMEQMPEDVQRAFADFSVKTASDYNQQLVDEIQRTRKEMRYVDQILNPINSVSEYEDEFDGEGEIPLELFDDLNS